MTKCNMKPKSKCDQACVWKARRGCVQREYFSKSTTLDKDKKKFCRCVMHVMAKGAPNPYAICAKSVKTTTGGKSCNYEMKSIPKGEVEAYMLYLHKRGKKSATYKSN